MPHQQLNFANLVQTTPPYVTTCIHLTNSCSTLPSAPLLLHSPPTLPTSNEQDASLTNAGLASPPPPVNTASSDNPPPPPPRARQIDVMVLYTEAARAVLGGVTHQQMITTIVESLVWTNQAFINSEVAVRFKAVLIGPVRS